jgi:hypothetical protein
MCYAHTGISYRLHEGSGSVEHITSRTIDRMLASFYCVILHMYEAEINITAQLSGLVVNEQLAR